MLAGDLSKKTTTPLNYTSYLDVSEYILKECSPQIKPSSPYHPHDQVRFLHFQYINYQVIDNFLQALTCPLLSTLCISFYQSPLFMQDFSFQEQLELQPIELEYSQILLTPVTKGLIRQEVQDILDDFILEDQNMSQMNDDLELTKRRGQKSKLIRNNGLEMFRFECDLDKIIEYADQQSYVSELHSQEHSDSEDLVQEGVCYLNSNTLHTVWLMKQKSKSKKTQETEEENKTTIDISLIDYSENIERFSKCPKTQIMKKIKEIEANTNETDDQQKKILIKKYLENYLLETEIFCFEEAWHDLDSSLKTTIAQIKSGIQQTFSRKIGPISFQCRRVKLLKYLQKKKRRIWRKKVSYDCRKKVADGRLRIKGKFVTREQASQQLGLGSLDNYSAQQIKEMLQKKMDQRSQQIICRGE